MEKEATSIKQEVIMAAALLTALSASPESSVEDVSSLLFKLKKAGVQLGDIGLRRVPGGFYSEDIEALIGHYLAAGYASQTSPVKLTAKGRQLLSEIIGSERNDNPQAVEQIEAVLGPLIV